jgi:hypothetical protein
MITVKYSCPQCGIKGREVQVPARDTAEADVTDWMNRTIRIVGEDHLLVSPVCRTSNLTDLMFPLKNVDGQEAEFIGQQIE